METFKDLREPDLEEMQCLEERRVSVKEALNKKLVATSVKKLSEEEAQVLIRKRLQLYKELAK